MSAFLAPARRALLAAAALTVALVSIVPTLGAGASPAQDADPPSAPHLLLEQQTPWVTPDGQFALRVAVPGDRDGNEVVDATLYEATRSRTDFTQEVGGDGLGSRVAATGPVTIDGGRAAVRFATSGQAAPGVTAARIDRPGVYPVEVRLIDGDGAQLDRLVTHLVRLPGAANDAPPLNLAMVVPIDAGPGIRPSGTKRTDPVGSDRLETLLDSLASHPNVPLVVVPTPDTVDTIANTPKLGRLRRAVNGRQVLSSQYVPVDVAAWVAAGMDDDLAQQTTAGDATLAEHLVSRPDRRTAITDNTITPDALTRLAELGADQVVIPEGALAPLDADTFPVTLGQTFDVLDGTGQTQRAVAADAGLAAHVDQTGDPVLDASTLIADLAVIYFDQPALTRGVTLVLPRQWTPPEDFLDTLLTALGQPSVVAPVTLDTMFARVPEATIGGADDPSGPPLVRGLAPAPSPPLGGYPEARRLTRLTTQGFISFAGRVNPVVRSLQRRLLVSGYADFDRSQRRAYIDAIGRQIHGATASVRAPARQTVTLTSRDGRIPLNLSNENLYDVTVRLQFDSEKLTFPDGDTAIIHLPRSSVTSLDVDVSARSSGTFPLTATITSPDQVLVVARSKFTVRSTAVSNVGLVLSVGAGLFLAIWWASHFHRVRRARRLVTAADAGQAVEK